MAAGSHTAMSTTEGTSSETTPLLKSSNGIKNSNGSANHAQHQHAARSPRSSTSPSPSPAPAKDEGKPFPYWQIIILCYASVVEPVAFFIIFPYINQMVERVGHQLPENVGFWTGTIESLFSLVQMLLIMFYGRIADRLGRKPVLVFSLTGIAAASALFGMSATLWQMVVFRCLAGLFAGSSVTIRAMLSENCTKATQAKAFGWFMFARQIGIFIGPAIGGVLADPAGQYDAFKHITFFQQFPYALPGFISSAFCLSTAIVSFFFLDETLPSKSPTDGPPQPEMTTRQLLKAPGVVIVIYIYSHVILQALAYTAGKVYSWSPKPLSTDPLNLVNPVAQYTPVHLGGFGFSSQLISLALALSGASQALWMLLAFPYLQNRFSTGAVLRGCCIVWPLMMACFPVLNELLRANLNAAFWTLGALCCFLGSGVAMSFACVQLCLNDIAPSPTTLATLNAVALTANSALRTVAPVGVTSLYAIGIKGGWLHGQLGWVVLVVMAMLLNVSVRWLPEKAEGDLHHRTKVSDEEEN
ncbi:hypothetical protein Q7P37_006413 [Cladosporium fusiforme]